MPAIANAVFRNIVRPMQLELRRTLSTLIDRRLGITTTDENVARYLGLDLATFRLTWRALGWTSCWRVLRQLPATPQDVFLDLGCGAGRVTCAAARRPYARVIGVDIVPEFASLARRNAAQLRQPHAACEIVQADAATYTVPNDVTVAFLYNSFQGSILDAALGHIIDSYDHAPRTLIIAYANPVEHERISASARLHPLRRLQLAWRPTDAWKRTQAVQLYAVVPPTQ